MYFPIGIAAEYNGRDNKYNDFTERDNSYCYNAFHGGLKRKCKGYVTERENDYGSQLCTNDILTMELDIDKGYLSFMFNGKEIKKKSKFNTSSDEYIAV